MDWLLLYLNLARHGYLLKLRLHLRVQVDLLESDLTQKHLAITPARPVLQLAKKEMTGADLQIENFSVKVALFGNHV